MLDTRTEETESFGDINWDGRMVWFKMSGIWESRIGGMWLWIEKTRWNLWRGSRSKRDCQANYDDDHHHDLKQIDHYIFGCIFYDKPKKNSVVWVREWTILTEWSPLVGELSVNFCGYRVPCGQRDWSLQPYSRLSILKPLLFLSSSSSVVVMMLSGPRSRPTTQKIW
jgi:hypothetical protein